MLLVQNHTNLKKKNQNVFIFKTLYSLKFKVLKEDVLLSTCNWVSKGTNKKIPLWEVEFVHKKECTGDITRHKRV